MYQPTSCLLPTTWSSTGSIALLMLSILHVHFLATLKGPRPVLTHKPISRLRGEKDILPVVIDTSQHNDNASGKWIEGIYYEIQ
jgi:hypothetical protein